MTIEERIRKLEEDASKLYKNTEYNRSIGEMLKKKVKKLEEESDDRP